VLTCDFRHTCHRFTIHVQKSKIQAVTNFDTGHAVTLCLQLPFLYLFFRRAKFVTSCYMKYHHVRRQECTKCSAQCSRLSQFGCCQWCSLSCTREDSSLLAITLSPYLVPRVFRIHVTPFLKGLYVLYRSIQSNSSAGNSYHPPETGEPADWTTYGNSVLLK